MEFSVAHDQEITTQVSMGRPTKVSGIHLRWQMHLVEKI
jgi:hypothetical protein